METEAEGVLRRGEKGKVRTTIDAEGRRVEEAALQEVLERGSVKAVLRRFGSCRFALSSLFQTEQPTAGPEKRRTIQSAEGRENGENGRRASTVSMAGAGCTHAWQGEKHVQQPSCPQQVWRPCLREYRAGENDGEGRR